MITARSLLPASAPVAVEIVNRTHNALTVYEYIADGSIIEHHLTLGEDGDVDGDASNDVLCEVERRLAKYGHKYPAVRS